MPRKLSLISWASVLLLCVLQPQVTVAKDLSTPGAEVRAFYSWYVSVASKLKFPLLDDRIYAYVEKKTVDALRDDYRRDQLPGDADYFTKVQDFDEKDWVRSAVIRPAVMLDDVAVVIATFGAGPTKSNVIVFLRRLDGTWKTMKVEDAKDYF